MPDESTILQFRHLLEAHGLTEQIFAAINQTLGERGLFLRAGTIVDASLIAAPTSTKNQNGYEQVAGSVIPWLDLQNSKP